MSMGFSLSGHRPNNSAKTSRVGGGGSDTGPNLLRWQRAGLDRLKGLLLLLIFSHRSESVFGRLESENRNLTRFGAPLWQCTGDRCRCARPDPPYYLIGSYNAQVKRPAVPCEFLASPKAGGYTPIDPDDASRVATMPAVQRRPAHRAD